MQTTGHLTPDFGATNDSPDDLYLILKSSGIVLSIASLEGQM